jgi:hypothetical protein
MFRFFIFILSFLLFLNGSLSFTEPAFSTEKVPTNVIVRVVANDAKVIGSILFNLF